MTAALDPATVYRDLRTWIHRTRVAPRASRRIVVAYMLNTRTASVGWRVKRRAQRLSWARYGVSLRTLRKLLAAVAPR